MKKGMFILCFLSILNLTSCSINLDKNGGEIVANLTKLPTPEIKEVSENIVYWDKIENASSYSISINSYLYNVGNNYQCSIGAVLDSHISANVEIECHIKVMAIGNHTLYSDSDWSSEFTCKYFKAERTTIGFSDAYKSNGLGRTLNVITASGFEPMSGSVSIFTNDLYKMNLIEERVGKQQADVFSSQSYDSFSNSFNLDVALKISKDSSQIEKDSSGKTQVYYLPNSLDFNIDVSGGYEKKKSNETKEFYYKMHQNIVGKRVEIEAYNDTTKFSSILSDSFLDDATLVNTGVMSAESFIKKYGTHVIMSAYYGGAIEATYYQVEHLETADLSWYVNASASLTYHLFASDISGSVDASIKSFETSCSRNKISGFSAKALGGSSQSFGSLESFGKSYNSWATSVNEDTYSIIDIPDGSLFCVWEYLDDSYAFAKDVLTNYMIDKCNENYRNISNKVTSLKYFDNLTFDDTTNTLNIDISE
ncbi:MAG: hypothetical protein GX638_17495, partial [Crenarchaeota archaeon]|nr:hypothetical protein [Thermoproteota archaeon]